MELDGILSGKEEEKQVETPVEKEVVESTAETDVSRETLPAETEKEHVKEAPLTDREKAFLAKADDEKKKRQELEKWKQEAEKRFSQPQTPAKEAEAPKQFWDDPEGSLKSFESRLSQEITKSRLNTAEMVARQRHTDFDTVIEKFGELLTNTPGLSAQWLNSQDPAEFAYKISKNHMELQEAGDIDKLRAKIEKETRLKIEGELKSKSEALEKEKASIPGTLSDVKGTAAGNKVAWTGPTTLDSILGR